MIHAAINHVSKQLDLHLKRAFGVDEDIVVTSNLVELDGTVAPHINNKMVLTLVNVKLDDRAAFQSKGPGAAVGRLHPATVAPIFLDLHLMVAAHFPNANYSQALEYLSAAIVFFHQRPVFDHQTSPDQASNIERLTMEYENLPSSELFNIWSLLGGKYLPSALYRMRLNVIEDDVGISVVPSIRPPIPKKNCFGLSAVMRRVHCQPK